MASSWNPTHVVVAVQRAKDLMSKGKNGTNDAFVTIALSTNKFQTSIKDKVIDPEWYEECDVPLPENYTDHHIIMQVCHRGNLGIDEFLGHLEIPLQNFDVYDPPRAVWYSLVCKPGQNKTKPRGEIEIRLAFEVKKAKDMDSMSITSSASKRFKMSKKSVKHVASAIGRKIKGPKAEKTADYIPDLTGLDSGNLDMEDIAENYASPTRRKLSGSDSLSLPSTSPAFARGSPRSSKGYSPFNNRRSRADPDTPTSSNASTEDVRQKADDVDSNDGSFTRTHRRGGSGSDVQNRPNRRLLTASRPKSSSTVDISTASANDVDAGRGFALMDEGFGKSRLRSATSASQISNEILPEVEENKQDEEKEATSIRRLSLVSAKIADGPVLIDDEESDDSLGDYKPSPIVPLAKKDEPTDIFTRITAQSELEKADAFNLVVHQAEPGEDIFTPIGKVSKLDTEVSTAHSAPIVEGPETSMFVKPKSRSKGGKKKSIPQVVPNAFDLLMANDEPEYDVDSTVDKPVNEKSDIESAAVTSQPVKPETNMSELQNSKSFHKHEDSNPFGEPTGYSEKPNPFDEPTKSSIESNPFGDPIKSPVEANPFGAPIKSPVEDNPFGEPITTSAESNPFDEPITTSTESNTFGESIKSSVESNPFGGPIKSTVQSNPFGEPIKSPAESNPFGNSVETEGPNPFDEPAESTLTHRNPPSESIASSVDVNPFGEPTSLPEDSNPFEEPTELKKEPAPAANPFGEPAVDNPFEETEGKLGLNPFEDEDDEDEDSSSFNRVGSFARAGSSRFSSNSRGKKKKKEKAAAPPPPKPQRMFPEKPAITPASTPKHSSEEATVTSKPPLPISNSPSKMGSSPSDSSRGKSKKEKKAPKAPEMNADKPAQEHGLAGRARSSSHNTEQKREAVAGRRDSDTGRMEEVLYHMDQPALSNSGKASSCASLSYSDRSERQPAVGAEAPDLPAEPKSMREFGMQTELQETQEIVTSEFRTHSKKELVDIIQKLRQQVRKKDEHAKDLEEYIDSLLLRVMSADPNLLLTQPSCAQQANKANKLR